MHANILNDGQRIFIYRQVNGWTNISLEATEENPKLTCDPMTTLTTAYREFKNCPNVSEIKIKWDDSEELIPFDEIGHMEALFEDLPEGTNESSGTSNSKTDAEVLYDLIEATNNNVTNGDTNMKVNELADKVNAIDTKLAYIVNAIDQALGKQSQQPTASPATTGSNAARKRPARSE